MAFYCATMLSMALELASEDPAYEDIASKFFEHFIAITDAMNTVGGTGLWDDADGFYYDVLSVDGEPRRLRGRSMVGIIPLLAAQVIDDEKLTQLAGFGKRTRWFMEHRQDLARYISYMEKSADGPAPATGAAATAGRPAGARQRYLLAVPSKTKLVR